MVETASDYLQRLGKFFHDIRVGRGVTLRAAAGNWSASTLSRFEHGEQDISAVKAVDLMARLGLEDTDFLAFYEAQPGNFPLTVLDDALAHNVKSVVKRRKAYFVEHPEHNTLTQLAAVLLDAAEHWGQPDFRFSDAQEQCLADRLALPEHYMMLEISILKVVGGPASHELLTLLWQRIERLGPKWPLYGIRLLMVWLGAIMDRDISLVDAIEAKLKPIFTHYWDNKFTLEYLPNWTYGEAAVRWLREPTVANEARVHQMVDDLMVMGGVDDARWFKNMFARMQHARVYHNYSIVDHPMTMTASHTIGELLRNQRQYFGLTLHDISQEFSVSALRRFETGDTQLAFGGLTRLLGALGLQPSQFFTYLGRTDNHPLGVIGLRAAYVKLSQFAPSIRYPGPMAVCQQFELEVQDKPTSILREQMFILYTLAGVGDPPTMRRDADRVFALLMQSDLWKIMELMAVQALGSWLTPAQMIPLFQHGRRILDNSPQFLLGRGHFFDGLNRSLVRLVKADNKEDAHEFLQQLDWLPHGQNASPEPGRL
ncbi:helix-turn-helix domain-containing protein [Lacticaseibacillus thailandensis]|uniref:helix-turn-helix domain-containing protein n=1 Tax=Lacticaseibacillus thailandensis TaxID=381741 RepID=UPI0006CF99C3|nr:helix-turn-helix transcriptional regulator [Lacticaseibacillus thailandensis]